MSAVLNPELPVPAESEEVVIAKAPAAVSHAHRDLCGKCKRPAIDWGDEVTHVDASIDARNGGPCEAELFVEAPVRWGFQGATPGLRGATN